MIPTSGHFVLFLRHGERAPLPADAPYADVDLTPAGYAAVASLSERLEGRLAWTAASPFLRCRVTARGLGREPEDDTRLGHPGAWVVDRDIAATQFADRTTEGVVRAQVSGLVLPGMRPASEAVPLLLSTGLDRIGSGSGVCVSHDAVIMPAMAWLFGADAADEWLAPLGGFAVHLRADGPVAVWRDRERRC
ncbi:MAG: histidine phosphatase family protein [Pseudomonadota bacterium]|nr:histidine phosphatase family protein [Pseudomonadota bacterium]